MSDTEFRPIAWHSASATDVGCVRDVNEDSLACRSDIGLWAVADGMGGHSVGDVASQKIVERLSTVSGAERLSDFVDEIDDAFIGANQEIIEYSEQSLNGAAIGSTVVAFATRGRVGICMWAGDSRLYRYRAGELTQLSRDHSQVEEMLQMGMLTPEQAIDHPDSHVITRAIGGENELFIDMTVFGVQVGDTYLLCSDGLYNALDIEDLEECMAYRDGEHAVSELLQRALNNQASDNVSLIVLKGESGG